jgi:putative endonuclease
VAEWLNARLLGEVSPSKDWADARGNMCWKIYILFSEKLQQTYVGCAEDVHSRLRQHNAGRVISTRNGRPWRIIHIEEVGNYGNVRKREKYYKSGAGRRALKLLFEKIQMDGWQSG